MILYVNLPGTFLQGGVYCAYAAYNPIPWKKSQQAVLSQSQGAHNEQHETPFSKVQVRAECIIQSTTQETLYNVIPTLSSDSDAPLLHSGVSAGNSYYVQPWHEFMPKPSNLQSLLSRYKCDLNKTVSYWAFTVNKRGSISANWFQLYFCTTAPSAGYHQIVRSYRSVGTLNTKDLSRAAFEATAKLLKLGSIYSASFNAKVEDLTVLSAGSIPPQWFDLRFVSEITVLAKRKNVRPNDINSCQGRALLSCVQNAQLSDVFNLENIIQLVDSLRNPASLLAEARNLIRLPDNAKQAVKRLADAKLSYDYSVKTTISDVKTLYRDLQHYLRNNSSTSIARGRSSIMQKGRYGEFEYRYSLQEAYKVYYGSCDESLLPLYRRLQNIGLDPSFEHVWNTIPYSFVVDWLYPVSELFEQIDYETSVATLPIHTVTHGRWETHSFSDGWLKVDISTFNRDLSKNLPDFPYFLPEFSPNMNWWNAGALIIQRIR